MIHSMLKNSSPSIAIAIELEKKSEKKKLAIACHSMNIYQWRQAKRNNHRCKTEHESGVNNHSIEVMIHALYDIVE